MKTTNYPSWLDRLSRGVAEHQYLPSRRVSIPISRFRRVGDGFGGGAAAGREREREMCGNADRC